MLQVIREYAQGWIAGIIIAAICISFALWGVQNYLSGGDSSDVLAKVNGVKITRNEVNLAYERLRQEYLQQAGSNELITTVMQASLRQNALEQLITQQVLAQAAVNQHYQIGDEQLRAAIMQIPAFQVNGQFSPQKFQQVLSNLLYSEQVFLAGLRQALMINQAERGISTSDFALADEVNTAIALKQQTRDIGYMVLSAAQFVPGVKLDDSEIKNYYEQHQQNFKTTEQVSISYIHLRPPADKVKNAEQQQKLQQNFSAQVEKLTDLTYTNPDNLEAAAKTLNLNVQVSPQFTQAGGSTEITKNPKVIAAAFSNEVMKQGVNSNAIELKDGSVIVLRVKDYQPSKVLPLSAVQSQIEQQLKQIKAQQALENLGKKIVADLDNGKSAVEIAKENKVTWQVKTAVQRKIKDIPSPIIDAAFTLPVSSDKKITAAAIALPDNRLAIVNVTRIINIDPNKVSAAEHKAVQNELQQLFGQADYGFYVASLMQKTKIDKK